MSSPSARNVACRLLMPSDEWNVLATAAGLFDLSTQPASRSTLLSRLSIITTLLTLQAVASVTGDWLEGDCVVGEAVVGEAVVGEALVGEALVGEAVVGEALVGEALVGEALVGELVIGEALVGEALVGEALVGEALVGEALVGESLVGDALVGDTLVGDSVVGEALVGDAVDGDSVVGDAVVADAVVGDAVVGDSVDGGGSSCAGPRHRKRTASMMTLNGASCAELTVTPRSATPSTKLNSPSTRKPFGSTCWLTSSVTSLRAPLDSTCATVCGTLLARVADDTYVTDTS